MYNNVNLVICIQILKNHKIISKVTVFNSLQLDVLLKCMTILLKKCMKEKKIVKLIGKYVTVLEFF